MYVDVQVSGRAESLDERDRTGVGGVALKARLLHQKSRDDPVHDTQQWREQVRMCGEEDA